MTDVSLVPSPLPSLLTAESPCAEVVVLPDVSLVSPPVVPPLSLPTTKIGLEGPQATKTAIAQSAHVDDLGVANTGISPWQSY